MIYCSQSNVTEINPVPVQLLTVNEIVVAVETALFGLYFIFHVISHFKFFDQIIHIWSILTHIEYQLIISTIRA